MPSSAKSGNIESTFSQPAPSLYKLAWSLFLLGTHIFPVFLNRLIIGVLAAVDIQGPGILLVDLSQYIVTVIIVLLVCFALQPTQDHILSLTHEIAILRNELQSRDTQISEVNAACQELQIQITETLALHRTEQEDHQNLAQRHRLLEINHADTLTTLELRDTQLAEARAHSETQQTNITILAEERDQLRETVTRTNRRRERAQTALRNLQDNFPGAADALVSIPHEIQGLVLTKDGRPDRRYNAGKPFCHFRSETTTVLCNGRRMYLMLTTVSE